MAITQSQRKAYVGAHVDPQTKRLLMRVAGPLGVSAWVSDAIEERLIRTAPEGLDAELQSHLVQLKATRLATS